VGDHLKVDLGSLRETGAALHQIKQALQRAEDDVRSDQGVLGSGELADAMHDFASNWKIHREKLISSVEAHEKMAIECADAYEQVDRQLADALREAGSATPTGGHP
jgi:hypothetical protein